MKNVANQLETLKILVPALHKIAVSTKTKSFGTFNLFFLIAWIFGIVDQIIQKHSLTYEVYIYKL